MSLKSKQAITAERQVPTIVNFKDYYDYVDNEILGEPVQLLPGCYRFFSGNDLIGNLVTSLNMMDINDTGTYFNNIIISVPDFGQFYKFKFFVYNKPGYELFNNKFYFRFREEVYTRVTSDKVTIGIRETDTQATIYINPGETLVVEGYWTPSASETSAKLTLFYYPRYDYESKITTIAPITYTFENLQTEQTHINNIEVTSNPIETSDDQNESPEETSEELTPEATESPEETSLEETSVEDSREETSEELTPEATESREETSAE